MNLREFIQSEIKLQLDESVNESSISIDKKVTNIINSRDFKKFVNYFNSFYGKNGIYSSGKDIAEKDIIKGLYNVFKRNNSYEWGDGDSVDRELVRDELFKMKVLSDKIYKNEALSVNEGVLTEGFNDMLKSVKSLANEMAKKKAKDAIQFVKPTAASSKLNPIDAIKNIESKLNKEVSVDEGILSNIRKFSGITKITSGLGALFTGLGTADSYLSYLDNKFWGWYYSNIQKLAETEILSLLKSKHAIDASINSWEVSVLKYAFMAFFIIFIVSYVVSLLSKKQESVNESEQLDEKLITFSNRAPYGQIVFMAGGAGSGKGFAIKNFIDSAGFKVRDVDDMKTALGKLDQLGKFSIDKWYAKYGNDKSLDVKDKKTGVTPREHLEEFALGRGYTIEYLSKNLKNPNNVASLHYIVDAMKLKDVWLTNMLLGKDKKETLPNLLFDITAKKVKSITEVIEPLLKAGYDSKNIHLIWVLTKYEIAVQQNKTRERIVPDDILLNTHEGATATIWGILTQELPKGLDGRIDVILNNEDNTIYHKYEKGAKAGDTVVGTGQASKIILVKGEDGKLHYVKSTKVKDDIKYIKGFLSLPIKKQGGGIFPESVWKQTLYNWIVNNAPSTVTTQSAIDRGFKNKED